MTNGLTANIEFDSNSMFKSEKRLIKFYHDRTKKVTMKPALKFESVGNIRPVRAELENLCYRPQGYLRTFLAFFGGS